MAEMRGGVYRRQNGFQVQFRGKWFSKDEYGRPLKAEFYAWAFLEHLNALYDPDPAKNRYDSSKFKDKTPHKFDEAFELYLDRKQNDSSWHKAKEWTWKKYFVPFFANQDFRTIDDVQLQGFVRSLEKKKLKGKTIKNIVMTLHGFLNHFRRSINLFPKFPAIKYQQARPKKFTDQEIDQVFEFIKPDDLGYFLFIRYYGVRPEEASGLLRSAINWETREITISTVYVDGKIKPKTKTMKERVLPIISEIEEYLRTGGAMGVGRGCKNQRNAVTMLDSVQRTGGLFPPDSIFIFQINGHPYTRHMREGRWRKAMKQAVQKYSTRPMTLRDLRSSATSRWLKKGMLIQDAAQLLGNSPEVIRRHYSDQTEDKVIQIVRGK